jgi:hypothetical protein
VTLNAVSIPQPHAAALLAGPGPVEYPAWRTDHRGPLLIHAAKQEGKGSAAAGLAYSALLGVVDLVDCVQDAGRGDEAGYRWVLANPRVFATPVPHNGKQGMFYVSDAAVADALAAAEAPRKKRKKN